MKTFFAILFLFSAGLLLGQAPRLMVPIGHSNSITEAVFSPDGNYILTGSKDQTAKLWDLQGREIQTFSGHLKDVSSVAFSPDGQRVLTGSYDQTAKLWDLQGREIQTFSGHSGEVISVAFSPDGQRVLTGSLDGTAKLWNLQGRKVQTFKGQDDVVAAAFSPDGQRVLTSNDRMVKLWDLRGREIQTFKGHSSNVISMIFSTDGQCILTGSWDYTAKLWDIKSGRELQTFNWGTIKSAAFSPDGQHILTVEMGAHSATLRDLQGRVILSFICHSDFVESVAFSPDGQRVLTSCDNTVKLWDLQGRELLTIGGHSANISSVTFSPDGQSILTGSFDNTAKLWDLQGQKILSFRGHSNHVGSVAFSPDGQRVLTGSEDFTAKLWDLQGREMQTFRDSWPHVYSVAFSPDGQRVLTGNRSTATLWDLQGKEILRLGMHLGYVYSVVFSPDGQRVLTGSYETVKLWDLQGQDILTFRGHFGPVYSVAFSLDGQRVLTGGLDQTARLWNLQGLEILTFRGHSASVLSVAFSSDGQRFLTGSYDNTAKLWDLQGLEILTFRGHSKAVKSAAFSPDGQHILTGSYDNTAKLWDTKSGKELATLIAIDSTDWVVTTPSGLFDASPGAMKLMYYVQGLEVIELDQLKERYHEPGLLSKIMGFDKRELRNVAAFDQVALYPEVKATIENDRLAIQLTERNGGLGKLSLFHNGKEIQEDINPNRQKSLSLDLNTFIKYYRSDTTNTFALRAYNAEGWLKSQSYELTYTPAKTRRNEKPSLYVLAVGASDYAGEQLDLRFADLDAEALAKAFSTAGGALFTPERTSVRLLHSSAKTPADVSAKTNIRLAFADIAAKAKPEDVVIVFFSGHGLAYGPAEKELFYYLTKDIGSAKLDDPKVRQEYTVSSEELTQWLIAIPAGKQVMIVDACNAGKVVESLSALATKDLDPSQIRALDRMKDRTGMFILTGSAADKVSYEASQYGQGLLTYSLLQGMSGLALTEDKRVDVMTLFQYSRDKVPELAKGIGGVQTPVLAFPTGGASFDIGIVNAEVKIPVAQVKPVFIRSNFQDENYGDELELVKALEDYFNRATLLGTQAELIYVNVNDYDRGYSIKGSYAYQGPEVLVNGSLFKGKTLQGKFQVTGKKNNVPGLVDLILEKVKPLIK